MNVFISKKSVNSRFKREMTIMVLSIGHLTPNHHYIVVANCLCFYSLMLVYPTFRNKQVCLESFVLFYFTN